MTIALALLVVCLVVYIALSRRDPRLSTVRSLPQYGTVEAAGLRQAISTQGPRQIISATPTSKHSVTVEPARDEAYFREQITRGGRTPSAPIAAWRSSRVKPVRPKPASAPMTRPGSAPPQQLVVPAARCRICSRPLTNRESSLRGVGPDCYRNYGARVLYTPNPAYAEWSNRKRSMDAEREAFQRLLDELFKELMQRFEVEMKNWEAARAKAS